MGLKFNCPKKGHSPMDGVPADIYVLNGYTHVSRVCTFCKGAYFEQVSDDKIEISPLLSPSGGRIVTES